MTVTLRLFLIFLVVGGFACAADEVAETASLWPQDIPYGTSSITLYQPQLETLVGVNLTGRAAVSYVAEGKSDEDRIFGALWFTAILDIDRESNIARVTSLTVTKVVTPAGEKTSDGGVTAKKAIQAAMLTATLEFDLDRLSATLENPTTGHALEINSEVPKILLRTSPTVLVVLDGEARVVESEGIKRVINTPSFLAADVAGVWWLRGENDWLTAPSMMGPWTVAEKTPRVPIIEAAKKAGYPSQVLAVEKSVLPGVIIASEPTELLVFDGKPSFAPIDSDGALLGATNSDATVIIEVATGANYLLVAGRWLCAKSLTENARWEMVKPSDVPEAFSAIPDKSEWAGVLTHVPGTPQADAAIAMDQIPQTARIPRTASISVTFDGTPQWVKVANLEVEYAANSADAVFLLPGSHFYSCRDGVWYESTDSATPFIVSTAVPDALHRLPPDCPWYNTTYVTVYESTPTYVWCGYTLGYMGWYTWQGCPIYGTGYRYPCWYGGVIYPRPLTWGVGIQYNPWNGWGVSVGVGRPHWSIGISSADDCDGWYGSGGVNNIYIDNSIHITNVTTISGGKHQDRPSTKPPARPSLYDRVPGAERPAKKPLSERPTHRPVTRPAALDGAHDKQGTRPTRDNLAVSPDGVIARPAANGIWQTRENETWNNHEAPFQKPANKSLQKLADKPAGQPRPAPAPTYQRTQQQRDLGNQRAQQRAAPATRPTPSNSSGKSGASGGGNSGGGTSGGGTSGGGNSGDGKKGGGDRH